MEADIINVDIKGEGENRYTFKVTVQHEDTGWDHYADRWEILTTTGEIIAVRILQHPHVTEQTFTRQLPFVVIPENINQVIIRAHCSVHEFGGKEISIPITR